MTALLRRLCERQARHWRERAVGVLCASLTLDGAGYSDARELADRFRDRAKTWDRWAGKAMAANKRMEARKR